MSPELAAEQVRGGLLHIDAEPAHHIGASLRRSLLRAIRRVSRIYGLGPAGIEVRIVDDETIAVLHDECMGDPTPTDVLSFPAEAGSGWPGQVTIALGVAMRQAGGTGVEALRRELLSLLVHGGAHLAGHDHATRPQARRMLRAELRAARRIGLPRLIRPYGGAAAMVGTAGGEHG